MKLGQINNKKQYWKQINKIVRSFTDLPEADSFYDVAYYYLQEKAWKWEWFDKFDSMINIMKFSESIYAIDSAMGAWNTIENDLGGIWINRSEDESPSFMGFIRSFAFTAFLEDCHKEFDKIMGNTESINGEVADKNKDIGESNIEI
jgi:hypothetical protein